MSKYLVIVESPAKAKTIEKFLGRNYKVKASIGHVRDLPKSKMGIDTENDFDPNYITIRGKGPVIKELRTAAKKADKIFLATDPDREGEAIAWHLAFLLNIDPEEACRVSFHEITKDAIKAAIKIPKKIDQSLVDAQQARRILDRLVGYGISPLLWRKIRKGLSAGRVQSVATKMICDKESLIKAFVPEEYWEINSKLISSTKKTFDAQFKGKDGKKLPINNQAEADAILSDLEKNEYEITNINKKVKTRSPQACFTTSSLQQEASSRFGFSTKKTMMIAQQLYEGINVKGAGTVGLITYMRTDSVRISEEARELRKEFIEENYQNNYVSNTERKKTNKKSSQDAHEAIRPTSVMRVPDEISESLSKDQHKLYKLIWERFVAHGMSNAEFDSVSVELMNGHYEFKANGTQLKFDGFLKVYTYTSVKENILPDLEVGETCKLKKIDPSQHFTQPPARFTEASLVKEMEEKGIGRPSTYAPTISTILSRGYVEREKKALMPTELGELINEIMESYFDSIVNVSFTADREEEFDSVENGNVEWKDVIRNFYGPFEKLLSHAEEEIEKVDLTEETDIDCDKCGEKMVIKYGRFGKFMACSNYPECKNTKPILKEIGIKCPLCKDGEVVERKTKKFRTFYGCSTFPDCRFVTWDKPTGEVCPDCGEFLVEKRTKKEHNIKCSSKTCKYKRPIEEQSGQ